MGVSKPMVSSKTTSQVKDNPPCYLQAQDMLVLFGHLQRARISVIEETTKSKVIETNGLL